MTKRTRVFLLVATAILFAGLGTGLVASYVGGFQNLVLIGSDGPEEFAYVPNDVQFVAYANVRDIMTSELRQKFQQLQQNAPDNPRDRFQQETGINFETDVDHIVASGVGKTADGQADRPLVLARGRFDAVRIEGLVRDRGGVVEDYKGTRLMTQSQDRIGVAFVEPDLVAVGTPEAVRRAIDTKAAGAGTVKDNAEVMRLVRDIDDGTAWAVARFDAVSGTGRLPTDVARQIPPINWFAATGHIDGGVRGTVRAEARDQESADNLREVIRGFMALARMQAGQNQQLATVINSLELSGQGTTVTLGFALPSELIDALASMRAERPRLIFPGGPDSVRPPEPPRPPNPPAPPTL